MNRQEDMAHKVAYMKSCITRQGFISGFSVAKLFNVSHEEFHDKMCGYYRIYGNFNQPTVYRQDKKGNYFAMESAFPYDITAMRADLGSPTFGFTSKHLVDLSIVYSGKGKEIKILIQTLMPVIKVSNGHISDAYIDAKQYIVEKKEFIYDFSSISEISVEEAEELFGRILIQDGSPSVKYRSLSNKEFPKVFEGINEAFRKKYPNGINRGSILQTQPQLEIENRDLWYEVK